MDQIQHQVGIVFSVLVEDSYIRKEIAKNDLLRDDIDELDIHNTINNAVSTMALIKGNKVTEADLFDMIKQTIKDRVDLFNHKSINNSNYMSFFTVRDSKLITIKDIVEDCYYELEGEDPAVEELVNDIITTKPEGSSLTIILYKIGIFVKDIPVYTFMIPNPFKDK